MSSLGIEWGAKYTLVGPDGTTVVFNDSSDPNFIGVLSPESSGLDSPDVREDATDATEEDGGHHGDFFEGRRPVVLQGTIIASSATQRNERVGKLKRATRALRRDATLTWKIAGGVEVELALRRQQPLRVTKGYTKDFQVGMVAADIFPRKTTSNTKTATFAAWGSFIATANASWQMCADSTYIYWADKSGHCIGRAKLDGTSIEKEWIKRGTDQITGVAVDGTYIYYANFSKGSIGRAKINGTEPNDEFITTPVNISGIAVDTNYIYWADASEIGRAKIDGSAPTLAWISTPISPSGICVDANYVYWADASSSTIGRAKIDGSAPNNEFISNAALGGYSTARDVSVDAGHIYWVVSNKLGRANIDGSNIVKVLHELPKVGTGVLVTKLRLYADISESKAIYSETIYAELVLNNEGDAPAFPIVKIYGPGETFKLENATTEESILLEGIELKEGEYFEIDFKNHTIKKNGTTYAYNALVFASSNWWTLEPGANNIVVTGGTAEVAWQDTFI